MEKKEIKDYLKMVNELETKLTGKDKETYAWLIYGYNQYAKLLNETEKQVKKQKEVIDKAIEHIENNQEEHKYTDRGGFTYTQGYFLTDSQDVLDILKEVSE